MEKLNQVDVTILKTFEDQLNTNQPITKDSSIISLGYFDGTEFNIGDVVLYAVLVGDPINHDGYVELPYTPIILNERHLHLFKLDERYSMIAAAGEPPHIKYK